MTVRSLTPDLMVEDVRETVEWYERVFDAEVTATLPTDADAEPWWAQLRLGEASLMIQERESLTEKLPALEGTSVGGSVAFYIDVDDADGLYGDLADAGVEVHKEPHETEFGWRQFAVEDCNGYVLWFGEQLSDDAAEEIGRRYRTYHDHLSDEVGAEAERGGAARPPGERG